MSAASATFRNSAQAQSGPVIGGSGGGDGGDGGYGHGVGGGGGGGSLQDSFIKTKYLSLIHI